METARTLSAVKVDQASIFLEFQEGYSSAVPSSGQAVVGTEHFRLL